jgi:hypothetical protein
MRTDQELIDAFGLDGYEADPHFARFNGKRGITARHRTAVIDGDPAKPKKAYYVEGSHREMGRLLGLMAEPDIALMTTHFVNKMLWELVFWHPRAQADPHDPAEDDLIDLVKASLGNMLADLIAKFSRTIKPDIPPEYLEELEGILEGCRAANPQTVVNEEDLWVLNFGIDWFMANIYAGLRRFGVLRRAIRDGFAGLNPPGMCNGFSLFGQAARGGHLFGRDFMFPTAGVFEKTACLIVYNPDPTAGAPRFPFVSLTAPGMMGCVSGMNSRAVAIGVEIAPAAAARPDHPGFNSLLLNRYCVETGGSAESAKDVIVNAKRGVPWIYIIADGTNDRACVVEAVYAKRRIRFRSFPPLLLRGFLFWRSLLPGRRFLRAHQTAAQENGVMVRWPDYAYDRAYLDFNEKLFQRFHKSFDPNAYGDKGFINGQMEDKNCPTWFFFAPQRETRPDMILTTNHFVIPEMRHTAMTDWLSWIFGKLAQDTQWRYDALNEMILTEIEAAQQNNQTGIDYATAKKILDFISPTGKYGRYYGPNKHNIEGAQSLFDLKALTVESHYGFYVDEWVKLSLGRYLP